MQPILLPDKILARLPFILILNHTGTYHNPLLRLMFHSPPKPNDLLPEIPWLLVIVNII